MSILFFVLLVLFQFLPHMKNHVTDKCSSMANTFVRTPKAKTVGDGVFGPLPRSLESSTENNESNSFPVLTASVCPFERSAVFKVLHGCFVSYFTSPCFPRPPLSSFRFSHVWHMMSTRCFFFLVFKTRKRGHKCVSNLTTV